MIFHVILELFQSVEHIENVVLRLYEKRKTLLEVLEIFPTFDQICDTHARVKL
jgi:predicted CopG family antitoxin